MPERGGDPTRNVLDLFPESQSELPQFFGEQIEVGGQYCGGEREVMCFRPSRINELESATAEPVG